MANLIQDGLEFQASLEIMDDREGPFALVVADDDGLRDSLCEVARELGFGAALRTFRTATGEMLRAHEPFALALICVGRGSPDAMRAADDLLASPALAGAVVLLGATAALKALPPLPAAGRAASVAFLRMPFDLDELTYLARERVAVAGRIASPRLATVAWDGALDQRRETAESPAPRGDYAYALLMDPCLPLDLACDLACLGDERVAKAC